MERLTVNNLDKVCYDPWELCGMESYCTKGCHEAGGCTKGCDVLKMYRRLAEYEDLEEQGKLLKLPCKIGDTIYVIPSRANYGINTVNRHKENNRVYEQIVDHITFYKSGYLLSTCEGHASVIEESYKETWFLTKEEAETALRKLKDVWKELEG